MERTLSTEASAILRDTKGVLLTHGWTQHALHTKEGYCLLGGTYKAAGALERLGALGSGEKALHARARVFSEFPALGEAVDRLTEETGSIVDWNDLPERTLDEVIDVLDKALYESSPTERSALVQA